MLFREKSRRSRYCACCAFSIYRERNVHPRETQLTNVKVGDPAELRIDQYPGQIIRGKVVEIAPASGSQFALLPPDNATGNFTKVVQRIPVKIALENPTFATKLRPGISVTATVRTRR